MTVDAVKAPALDILRTVFPVVALERENHGQAVRPDFFGTAFAIAPGWFLTAGHVVQAAEERGALAIAGPTGLGSEPLGAARAIRFELFKGHDLALVQCNLDASESTLLNVLLAHELQLLTDVSSFGYPHAVTTTPAGDQMNVLFRGYKGHVITIRSLEGFAARPLVYEVSTPFPLGMSGAPLLFSAGNAMSVVGVVLAVNTISYGDIAHHVGIALTSSAILSIRSEMLGGLLAEKLPIGVAKLGIREPDPD